MLASPAGFRHQVKNVKLERFSPYASTACLTGGPFLVLRSTGSELDTRALRLREAGTLKGKFYTQV